MLHKKYSHLELLKVRSRVTTRFVRKLWNLMEFDGIYTQKGFRRHHTIFFVLLTYVSHILFHPSSTYRTTQIDTGTQVDTDASKPRQEISTE